MEQIGVLIALSLFPLEGIGESSSRTCHKMRKVSYVWEVCLAAEGTPFEANMNASVSFFFEKKDKRNTFIFLYHESR